MVDKAYQNGKSDVADHGAAYGPTVLQSTKFIHVCTYKSLR